MCRQVPEFIFLLVVFHCVLSRSSKKLILTLMDIWIVSSVENGFVNVLIDVFWCSRAPVLKVYF